MRIPFSTKLITLLLLGLVLSVTAKAQALPGDGVDPVEIDPSTLAEAPQSDGTFEVPVGFETSAQRVEDLKRKLPGGLPTGGTQVSSDPNTGAPTAGGSGFPGPSPNGWAPYDAALAVGPNHVLALVNAQWVVYNKSGTVVQSPKSFASWWGTSAGTPFDPKCYYDPSGHFVMIAPARANGLANMYVSVSQTSDPTGLWWNYTYDWRLDGTTATSNWGDFPGLGCDDNSIYINANQYSISGNSFQYTKVRVLSKAQLFSGATSTYVDFTGLLNADGSKAFSAKPAVCLSASSSGYLVNTRSGGGSYLTVWRIDNGPSAPTLTRVGTTSVGSYGVPPQAPQLGTTVLVATGDCRTQDAVWRNGFLHTAFNEAFNNNAAIRYVKISTGTAQAANDITYAGSGIHMYYPAVTVDDVGSVLMTYSRSSSTEYIGLYYAGKAASDASIGPSTLIKAGTAAMTQTRWGDYSAVANDGASGIWMFGGYGGGGVWNSWITSANYVAPPPSVPQPPGSLTAVGSDQQISLSWSATSGAAYYNVYRSTTPNTETLLATGVLPTSYVDSGLANGTTYYYVVTGVNDVGESGPSPEASATPQLPAPTNLSASSKPGQITLRWTQSTSGNLTGNRIYRATSSAGPYTVRATVSPSTSYVDTGTKGTIYYYKVTALTATAESGFSNVVSINAK